MLGPLLVLVERLRYRLACVDANREQRWTTYTMAMLIFNSLGLLDHFVVADLPNIVDYVCEVAGAPSRAHQKNAPVTRGQMFRKALCLSGGDCIGRDYRSNTFASICGGDERAWRSDRRLAADQTKCVRMSILMHPGRFAAAYRRHLH
ncbi:potassium-transporting ATPase subunit KdpA [Nevskia soli]|uniref:potassium-transporting ATPase subunit KdpA n=1 Tax=Nevskia soli TaxID=418856 RepID=UPI001B80BDFE